MSTKDPRINYWRSLVYHDPAVVLRKLRALEQELAGVQMPERVRRLRTPGLKKYREWRDAALFCYGLGQAQGRHIQYATEEAADYDFVASWVEHDTQHFVPVQLKELVPADLNPDATLKDLLMKVSTGGSTDTVLVVRLNRRDQLSLSTVHIPQSPWKQIWFLWASSPDSARWSIYGDALHNPAQFSFAYPPAA